MEKNITEFFFFAVVFLVLYLTYFWQFHQQKVKFWTHNISHWLIVNKEGSPKATPQKGEWGFFIFHTCSPFAFHLPFTIYPDFISVRTSITNFGFGPQRNKAMKAKCSGSFSAICSSCKPWSVLSSNGPG